jgi:hypothetical protein
MNITPKVAGILRQGTLNAGSVESVQQPSSEDGIIGIMHVNNIKGYVLGFCGVPKETGKVMTPTISIRLPPKSYRGFVGSFDCFLS